METRYIKSITHFMEVSDIFILIGTIKILRSFNNYDDIMPTLSDCGINTLNHNNQSIINQPLRF